MVFFTGEVMVGGGLWTPGHVKGGCTIIFFEVARYRGHIVYFMFFLFLVYFLY